MTIHNKISTVQNKIWTCHNDYLTLLTWKSWRLSNKISTSHNMSQPFIIKSWPFVTISTIHYRINFQDISRPYVIKSRFSAEMVILINFLLLLLPKNKYDMKLLYFKPLFPQVFLFNLPVVEFSFPWRSKWRLDFQSSGRKGMYSLYPQIK